MAWDNIIGQDRIKQILSSTIINNRIPSSLIFNGIDGVGKEAIALEFAKLLNDPNRIVENGLVSVSDSFDKRWNSNVLNHNNINLIFALPTGDSSDKNADPINSLNKAQLTEVQTNIEKKNKNYYHKVSIERANFIKINQIRRIKNTLKLSAPGSGYRVFIIADAHKMNQEAANAFLKTIEEPAEKTVLILITNNIELLLQTIRSRCQIINFSPLSDENIIQYLKENDVFEEEAKLILPFAEGSVQKAGQYIGEEINILREAAIELLRKALTGKGFRNDLVTIIQGAATSTENVKLLLLLISIWLRDAERVNSGYEKVSNFDKLDALEKFAKAFSDRGLSEIVVEIEKAELMLKQNVNPKLLLISLLMKIRHKLRA